jgi:hypothetical protein
MPMNKIKQSEMWHFFPIKTTVLLIICNTPIYVRIQTSYNTYLVSPGFPLCNEVL